MPSLHESEAGKTSTPETDTVKAISTPVQTPVFDEAQVKKLLEDANELKQEGNDHFRSSEWNEALVAYRSALGRLPKRPAPPKQKETLREVDELDGVAEGGQNAAESSQTKGNSSRAESPPPDPTPLQTECKKARAVLNANIAACHVKLGEHNEVVAACTEALLDDPSYVKALQRRAASNEQLDTWASLTSAQEDYTKLLDLSPPGSAQYIETRRVLSALKPRVEDAQKRETSEMMDKLKGIGNSILGNFGLSTNNFQFTPNGQGGYSMQFVR
ncbi:TPR-like protein [Cytidiella melzeri]|nr:TPR-like protein [Cytidiella melzeri]